MQKLKCLEASDFWKQRLIELAVFIDKSHSRCSRFWFYYKHSLGFNRLSVIKHAKYIQEKQSIMRCDISSRAGQVLAKGHLFIEKDEHGELRLSFKTDGGKLIQGGAIDPDGNLTEASNVLFRQFFETWKMSGITLTAEA